MDFATAVDRVRDDFTEMPTLELTVPQAVRLWHLGVDDCRFVLDASWTPDFCSGRRAGRSRAAAEKAGGVVHGSTTHFRASGLKTQQNRRM